MLACSAGTPAVNSNEDFQALPTPPGSQYAEAARSNANDDNSSHNTHSPTSITKYPSDSSISPRLTPVNFAVLALEPQNQSRLPPSPPPAFSITPAPLSSAGEGSGQIQSQIHGQSLTIAGSHDNQSTAESTPARGPAPPLQNGVKPRQGYSLLELLTSRQSDRVVIPPNGANPPTVSFPPPLHQGGIPVPQPIPITSTPMPQNPAVSTPMQPPLPSVHLAKQAQSQGGSSSSSSSNGHNSANISRSRPIAGGANNAGLGVSSSSAGVAPPGVNGRPSLKSVLADVMQRLDIYLRFCVAQ